MNKDIIVYDAVIQESIELCKVKQNYVITKDELLKEAFDEITKLLSDDELISYYNKYLSKLSNWDVKYNLIFYDFILDKKTDHLKKLGKPAEILHECDRVCESISQKDLDEYENYNQDNSRIERFLPFSYKYYDSTGLYDILAIPTQIIALKSKIFNKYLDKKIWTLIELDRIDESIKSASKYFNKQLILAISYKRFKVALKITDRQLKKAYSSKDMRYVLYVIAKKASILYDLGEYDELIKFYDKEKSRFDQPNILEFEKICMLLKINRKKEAQRLFEIFNEIYDGKAKLFVNFSIYNLSTLPIDDFL